MKFVAIVFAIVAIFAFVDARKKEIVVPHFNEKEMKTLAEFEEALIKASIEGGFLKESDLKELENQLTARGKGKFGADCAVDPNTNVETCCLKIPNFTLLKACGVIAYDEVKNQLSLNITVSGFPVFSKVFPAWQLGYCAPPLKLPLVGQASVCANITDEDLSPTGVCGCLSATLNIKGGLNIPFPIGCFAFGKSAGCTNCDDFDGQTKIQCQTLSHCGWCCSNNRNCEPGNAQGSTSQPVCSGSHWAFDQKSSCVP